MFNWAACFKSSEVFGILPRRGMCLCVRHSHPFVCFFRGVSADIPAGPQRWGSVTGSPLRNCPRIEVTHTHSHSHAQTQSTNHTGHLQSDQRIFSSPTTHVDPCSLIRCRGEAAAARSLGICLISELYGQTKCNKSLFPASASWMDFSITMSGCVCLCVISGPPALHGARCVHDSERGGLARGHTVSVVRSFFFRLLIDGRERRR